MKIAANQVRMVIALICGINFVVWGGIGGFLGGDAFNGKVEGDKYFLSSHGRFTQVSRSVYMCSRIHGYTAFSGLVVFFLMILSDVIEKDDKKKKASGT